MADRPPDDFGRKLREARERRSVSLRQIANATKISVSTLEALERNDISRLPGGIFSRGFVRSYAREVGLDPEAMIQEFIAQFPGDSVTAGHPTSKLIEDNEAIESDRRTATTFVRLVGVSLPIAAVVLYFGMTGRRTTPPAVPDAPPAVTSPAPAAASTTSSSASPAAPASDAAADGSEGVDRVSVALSATRECWVYATVDGKKTIERVLQPGEQRNMEVHQELVLTAGDGAAIVMTLNGAEAKPLGRQGEVVTLRLNLRNFRDYLSHR